MADIDPREPQKDEDADLTREGNLYVLLETGYWLLEGLVWLGRIIVGAIVAALHGCS